MTTEPVQPRAHALVFKDVFVHALRLVELNLSPCFGKQSLTGMLRKVLSSHFSKLACDLRQPKFIHAQKC